MNTEIVKFMNTKPVKTEKEIADELFQEVAKTDTTVGEFAESIKSLKQAAKTGDKKYKRVFDRITMFKKR